MAYILIDGYNLIGIAHKDLEKARNELIQRLCTYSALRRHEITLVFDGWKDGQSSETRTRVKDVSVIYSRLGEKADAVIKRFLSENRRSWIVVSSDREIADFTSRLNCVPLTSDEFDNKLCSALYSSGDKETAEPSKGDIYFKDDAMPALQKGNPRKPSKKLIKKLRALKKL